MHAESTSLTPSRVAALDLAHSGPRTPRPSQSDVSRLWQHREMRFSAELEAHGKTATGVEVPEEVIAGLGAGRRAPVRATINGYSWRTSIGAMGGRALVGVNAEARAGAGVAAGDVVDVELEHDTEPRMIEVPPDLAAALAASPAAAEAFERLSHSNQRRHVEGVLSARKPETRSSRITATVSRLEG